MQSTQAIATPGFPPVDRYSHCQNAATPVSNLEAIHALHTGFVLI